MTSDTHHLVRGLLLGFWATFVAIVLFLWSSHLIVRIGMAYLIGWLWAKWLFQDD